MTERVSMRGFTEAVGATGWRVLAGNASAYFRTGSFGAGVRLTAEIGRVSEAAGHHADVDVRPDGVTVRLPMSPELEGLTDRDADLAGRISAAARDLGVDADPSVVQDVQLTIDALVAADVMPFWAAVLGYDPLGDEDVVDPHRRNPGIWFQDMDAPRPQRNRIHVDVFVPHDQAQARVDAALAAGGRVIRVVRAPQYWTLADAEGNEVDVTTWRGREED